MKRNMGVADSIIRIVAAIVFIVLFATGTASGFTGPLLVVVAGLFIPTSLTGFCPLYLPFGITTRRKTWKTGTK